MKAFALIVFIVATVQPLLAASPAEERPAQKGQAEKPSKATVAGEEFLVLDVGILKDAQLEELGPALLAKVNGKPITRQYLEAKVSEAPEEDRPLFEQSKPMMLVYPSADGPVATLDSEAVRCGLNDLRYLVTLENLLKQVAPLNPARAAEMRKTCEDLLTKYGYTGSQNWGRMIYGALDWPEHQATVPNRQFDADRQQVIRMILECQQLLR